MGLTISLLHATHHRLGGPLAVKEAWLERATQPDRVEYILAMDDDDEATVRQTDGHLRVISPSGNGAVTAVRNWNAAAAQSTGGLLMVIADDLFPPSGWDITLLGLIGRLDPLETPFTVKLSDDSSAAGDVRLRHPVVSRAYYRRHGLFGPRYRGLFCDDDLTTRAFWKSVIIDGRSLWLEHRHPTLDAAEAWSTSQRRMNSADEWAYGRDLYRATWNRRQRLASVWLVSPGKRPLTARRLRLHRLANYVSAFAQYRKRRAVSLAKLLADPRALRARVTRDRR